MAKKAQTPNSGFQTLKNDLRQKNPQTCYVFYGEEAFLKDHYFRSLKKLLLDDLTEQFNFHYFNDESFTAEALADSVDAYPMMAERSLIQVDEIDLFKLDEAQRSRVTKILNDLPPHCCLVFTYHATEFHPDKRQKLLWEALSGHAELVEFQKQGERELCDWVARHFLNEKKQISPELCRHLVQRTGGSMSLLNGEIPKIVAYTDAAQITRQDIDAVVEPVLDAVAFDISNAVAAGDYPEALMKLRTLMQKQVEPIAVLGALGRQLRQLNIARILLNAGRGVDTLAELCGIGSYAAGITLRQARSLSDDFCRTAVLLCVQTDEQMKSGFGNAAGLLELLLLRLAQEARK